MSPDARKNKRRPSILDIFLKFNDRKAAGVKVRFLSRLKGVNTVNLKHGGNHPSAKDNLAKCAYKCI